MFPKAYAVYLLDLLKQLKFNYTLLTVFARVYKIQEIYFFIETLISRHYFLNYFTSIAYEKRKLRKPIPTRLNLNHETDLSGSKDFIYKFEKLNLNKYNE